MNSYKCVRVRQFSTVLVCGGPYKPRPIAACHPTTMGIFFSISIHLPMRGTTQANPLLQTCVKVSIHAPVMGATAQV